MIVLLYSNAYSQSTITSTQDGDWSSASTWAGGVVPGTGDKAIIAHTVSVDATTEINDLDINGNKTLNVDAALTVTGDVDMANVSYLNINSSGSYTQSAGDFTAGFATSVVIAKGKFMNFSNASSTITLSGVITLNSDSNEFAMLQVKGSFADPNSSGFIDYKKHMVSASTWELAGSPVSSLSINTFVNSNSDIADNGSQYGIGVYDNTSEVYASGSGSGANTWLNYTTSTVGSAGNFISGKGYQMATDGGSEVSFKGKLTTGSVSINCTNNEEGSSSPSDGTRYSLLANPYSTYINVSTFLTTNSTDLHADNGSVYVWNGSSMTAKSGDSGYKLAPGEGFIIGTVGPDETIRQVDFTTSMMATDGGDNAISGDPMEDNVARFTLKAEQAGNEFTSDIYFVEGRTDGFDFLYDAGTLGMMGSELIATRLIDGDQGLDLGAQSLEYFEMSDKIIPLAIYANQAEEYKISISENSTPADLNIYLEDAFEETMTDLKAGDYVFTPTNEVSGAGRFFIHTTADTMSNGEVSTSMLNAFKEVNANYITLEGLATQLNNINVSLYNILGRKVLSTSLSNNMNTQTISTLGMASGIYVIELESGNDRLTKKLIIQ